MSRSVFSIMVILWVQAYLLGPELQKFPLLVAHYMEHCSEEEELGFMTFLDLHYADAEHQENGDDDHEQLPYHHHHGAVDCCGAPVYFAQSMRSSVVPASSLPPVGPLPTEEELLSGHTRGLIQPPRLMA